MGGERPASGLGVRLSAVSRRFLTPDGPVPALESLDLAIPPGELVALLGPSGCGKSTLLRLVAGLDRPDAGEVEPANGAARRHDLAFVFQDAHLLPWRTVLANVELPLELTGLAAAGRRQAAREALAAVGLGDAERRVPAELSGGMRMRVSLARALVTHPRLLLLDEPFAAVDEITRQSLDDLLRRIWEERRPTVLFVTHSLHEAAFLAERAVVLSRRPGRVMLDRRLDLPAERTAPLRTDPRLAAEMRHLQQALERGYG